jgi:hypothetical protein
MTENKPKIKLETNFLPYAPKKLLDLPRRNSVVGLETHTFDTGNAKYVAKYLKYVEAIANHVQK